MIIELEINGARVIISGDNLTVNVSGEDIKVDRPLAKPMTAMTLRQYLKMRGFTQAEFAEAIGSHQVNVNRLVNGNRRPSWSMISRIEKATDGLVNVNSWLEEAMR